MKLLKFERFRILILSAGMLFASALLISCSDDDGDEAGNTIVDVAQGNNDLSLLVDALGRVDGFVSTLSDENGTFTVFAPTNEAFTALLAAVGQTSLDDVPTSVLERILSYHVISGNALASGDLSDGQTAATLLADESVSISTSGGVTINSSNVTTADVQASNGIIHIVDAVLVPSLEASIVNTVVEPAYFNNNFTILTEAVVTAGLLNTLIDPEANLTVFAPTNDAFAAAGITSLEGLTADDLTPILTYHVLGSEVLAADLPATGSAITSLGGDFYLSINDNGVFINGNSEVTSTDIDVANGVVHVINRTLVPASGSIVDIAVAASQATDAEFGQLVAALTAVENDASTSSLVTILSSAEASDGAPFTVFAPTDDAFAQLLEDAGVADLDALIAAVGINTLEAVLLYHVIGGGRVFSADLPNLESTTVTTLGGSFELNLSALTITETDNALGLNMDDEAAIIGTDIIATNGVIHTIDKVILP